MRILNSNLRRALALASAGVAIGLTTTACGSHAPPNLTRGREIFRNGVYDNQACSFCHTMRAAGAAGTFAPNLDQDINEDRHALHMSEKKIRDLVLIDIKQGHCLDPNDPSRCMPADLATGQDATDVATFVTHCTIESAVAGCLAPAPATSLAARGAHLYGSLKCMGCHSTNGNVAVAPTFKGLAGSQVMLATGRKVTADDNYLLVSILAPDAQIAKGYKAGFMTQVIFPHSVSQSQAKAIIAYIKTLRTA